MLLNKLEKGYIFLKEGMKKDMRDIRRSSMAFSVGGSLDLWHGISVCLGQRFLESAD